MATDSEDQPIIMREMVFIDAGGSLYRGFGRCWPEIIWDPVTREWKMCSLPQPQDWNWGSLVTPREAERCYPGSTSTLPPPGVATAADLSGPDLIRFRPELFDDYDGPIYRKSPEERAEDQAEMMSQLKKWGREDILALINRRKEKMPGSD